MAARRKKVVRKSSKARVLPQQRTSRYAVLVVLAVLIAIICIVVYKQAHNLWRQVRLDPFYETSGLDADGPLGEVVRQEPMNGSIPGGKGYRILYRSQKGDGSLTFSSGMIFIPNAEAPPEGRKILAWAHGTVGMGDQCAPSRTRKPIGNLDWIGEAMARNWTVVATDYSGLGTPGTEEYLIGQSEANDVLNSVRAARDISRSASSNQFVVWGHSQGGHSSLFTSALASQYAPELQLMGTVASAPAAELQTLLQEQDNLAFDWTLGPEVVLAWPSANPSLNVDDILTSGTKYRYKTIAEKCIEGAALDGLIMKQFNQQFFSHELSSVPAWNAEAAKQTAPILAPSQPVLVSESTTDNVILPNTTALYIQKACQAGSNLTSLWVSNVTHMDLANVTGPDTIGWIADRFNNVPNVSNCNEPSPVAPAQPAT